VTSVLQQTRAPQRTRKDPFVAGCPHKLSPKGRSFRWYYPASAFFLLLAMQAFSIVDRLVYGEWVAKAGDKITQGLNLLMIATGLLLFWRASRRGSILAGETLALALAAFLLLSALWSIDPETTIRRGALYVFFVIGVIGVAGNLDGDKFMDLLGVSCLLAAAASIVLLVISPSEAMQGNDLRGIFANKNVLGPVMAAGALASLHGIRIGGGRRLPNIFTLIVFIVVAFAAKSATSLLIIFAFCTADRVVALFRRARILGTFSIIFLVPTAVIVALSLDSVLEMMGKDPTLTGRTDLWAYLTPSISERPMLGWGHFAFWSLVNPAANEISSLLGWRVTHAHNGLLEMLLEVGIVGTIFFVFLWARNVMLALRCLRTPAKGLAVSSLLCCGGIVLMGISEHVLVDPSQVLVSVFFITGLMCERAVRRASVPAASQREHRRRAGKAKDATVNEGSERQIPCWHPRTGGLRLRPRGTSLRIL
jgi:exopolysaccharide production protein ExoQ